MDIACHCHHHLDIISRKYQKPPKTVCTPELSREALADIKSALSGLVPGPGSLYSSELHHSGKGQGECPEAALARTEYLHLSDALPQR